MATVESMECPGCRAPLPMQPGVTHLTCEFCGRQVEIKRTAEVPAAFPFQVRIGQRDQVVREALAAAAQRKLAERARRPLWPLILGLVLTVGVGLTFLISILVERSHHNAKAAAQATREDWNSHSGPVVIADVNGQGPEDFIGFTRRIDGAMPLYLAAYDGATMKPIWHIGPVGTWNETAYMYDQIAVAGKRLILIDVHAKVHVLELATGHEVAGGPVTDHPERACSDPSGAPRAFFQIADDKNVMVDDTGKITPAETPPWCPTWKTGRNACNYMVGVLCIEAPELDWKTQGMHASYAVSDGDRAVVGGYHNPGSPRAMVAAYAGTPPRLAFARSLIDDPAGPADGDPAGATLHGQRGFVTWATGERTASLAAFDLGTGQPLWTVDVPDRSASFQAGSLAVSDTRLYLPHGERLDIFDTQTGAVLGSIGRNN